MNEVAISVKQPWAYLLCASIKPIENRTWKLPKKHIGKRVYIHASGKAEKNFYFTAEQTFALDVLPNKETDVINSAIIGYVDFTDCVINHPSIWAEKSELGQDEQTNEWLKPIYNWVVSNAVLFDKPILNVKGNLSFWDCSKYIHSELDEDGKPVCMCNIGIDEKDQVISYGDYWECKYCGGKWYK